MRGNHTTLRLAEVRAALRLCNDLHDAPPDPPARMRRFLRWLCRLLRADAGVCVVTTAAADDDGSGGGMAGRSTACAIGAGAGASGDASVVSIARWAVSEDDTRALAARYQPRSHGQDARRRTRRTRATGRDDGSRCNTPTDGDGPADPYQAADHCLDVSPVSGAALRACVTLLRRPPGRRPFTARDHALLDLFHGEMVWLYRHDPPAVSPDAAGLSPRQRQTLQLLLAGNGEKQIATELDLSHNTVHHHVKALYRHFGVSSRSELLARWVTK